MPLDWAQPTYETEREIGVSLCQNSVSESSALCPGAPHGKDWAETWEGCPITGLMMPWSLSEAWTLPRTQGPSSRSFSHIVILAYSQITLFHRIYTPTQQNQIFIWKHSILFHFMSLCHSWARRFSSLFTTCQHYSCTVLSLDFP